MKREVKAVKVAYCVSSVNRSQKAAAAAKRKLRDEILRLKKELAIKSKLIENLEAQLSNSPKKRRSLEIRKLEASNSTLFNKNRTLTSDINLLKKKNSNL